MENCTKCSRPVSEDQVFYACNSESNLPFHPSCLACQTCQKSFDLNSDIYVNNSDVFCYDHYLQQFGPQCQSCEEFFQKEDLSVKISGKFITPSVSNVQNVPKSWKAELSAIWKICYARPTLTPTVPMKATKNGCPEPSLPKIKWKS